MAVYIFKTVSVGLDFTTTRNCSTGREDSLYDTSY